MSHHNYKALEQRRAELTVKELQRILNDPTNPKQLHLELNNDIQFS